MDELDVNAIAEQAVADANQAWRIRAMNGWAQDAAYFLGELQRLGVREEAAAVITAHYLASQVGSSGATTASERLVQVLEAFIKSQTDNG